MASPLITRLTQVCIVVEDFETSVRELAGRFGLGPWKCWDYSPPKILQTRRSGRPADWRLKLGVAWAGRVQLEVIQPTGGPTIYRDYLDAQGQGVQHLLVGTGPGYFDAIRAFEAAGYPAVQGARINPPMQIGPLSLPALPGFLARSLATQFVYHDTAAALGTVIEISRMPPGISFELGVRLGKADFEIPPGPGAPLVTGIAGVGLLVPDLELAMRSWTGLGVGPWQTTETAAGDRTASAGLAPARIDLVQPAAGSFFRSLLDTYGPGVQYLSVSGAPAETFAAAGFPVLEADASGVYIDARSAAHTIFRLAQ